MKKIIKLIESLGRTADDIARNLEIIGVKGKQGEPCDCPIANLLTTVGNCKKATVHLGKIKVVFKNNVKKNFKIIDFNNFIDVKNFIVYFDKNKYPYLIED